MITMKIIMILIKMKLLLMTEQIVMIDCIDGNDGEGDSTILYDINFIIIVNSDIYQDDDIENDSDNNDYNSDINTEKLLILILLLIIMIVEV